MLLRLISVEFFVRILALNCGQNNSYKITVNDYQARKIDKIRNFNCSLKLWETLLRVKAEVQQVEYLTISKNFGENLA